jgi:calcineurin-like phosphoesterase family protein
MKVTLNNGQKLWFTSDTHFSHANICSATTQWNPPHNCREFASLEEMNNALVNNINELVDENDILFHLGDWSFGGFEQIIKFREQIHCKNIHIITGNHDQHIEKNKEGCQSLFSSVNKYLHLNVKWNVGTLSAGKQSFVLMHFPIASWDNMALGHIHLHGHVHLPPHRRIGPGKMMDVGCDGNGLKPIELGEVLSIMNRQPIKGMFESDHHEIVEHYI